MIDIKRKKVQIFLCLLPALLFVFFISLSSFKFSFSYFFSDKTWHFIDYLVVSFMVAISCNEKKYSLLTIVSFVIILATSIGALIEFLQMLTPTRTFDYCDMLANFYGSIAGAFVYLIFRFGECFCKKQNNKRI